MATVLAALLLLACDRGAQPAKIGGPAPDFTIRDGDRSVTLSQLRGKIVVLNFWASWCLPCVQEMPSLVELQRRMGDRMTVLAVSLDQDETAYRNFLRDYKITLLTVRDPSLKSSRLYGTTGYPETYIIDAGGVVRRKFIGPVEWTRPEIVEYLTRLQSGSSRAAK